MKEERFKFGENWSRFLKGLNQERIDAAKKSLLKMLNMENMEGLRFLDIGSGSGLFSLASRNLGAFVYSFDYDEESVKCTRELKRRFFENDDHWQIERGSILDRKFIHSLGTFDIVYAWGVLHHTGNLVEAMENTVKLAAPKGKIFISIYNDQGWISKYWKAIKKSYNANALLRLLIIILHFPYLFCLRFVVRMLKGRTSLNRGMSLWHDMIDWLGGYPFEVAKPETIVAFYQERGFHLVNIKTCGTRQGCNEFVFDRVNPEPIQEI